MKPDCCICVFAKPPEAGKVKTRLIPMLGAQGAARLADAFLQDTLDALAALPWVHRVLASTEPVVAGDIEVWLQGEGDLGARIETIARRVLSEYPYFIAIGGDTPGLPLALLEAAHLALTRYDAVIGPCDDGGFYLLGLRGCPESLLGGINWSAATTCAETLSRLGPNTEILDNWFDVDTPEDLRRLWALIDQGAIHAPATRECLASRVSVIIPVFNEREHLPRTVESLRAHSWISEIVIADGGSTDGTREWLAQQPGIRVLDAPRGKGPQLNAAARAATGGILLFLHADCELPPAAGDCLREQLSRTDVAGGCFCVRFAGPRRFSLSVVEVGINLRTRRTGRSTGDQGIFVRRAVFDRVDGFPDWPLFEDVEFVRRIRTQGRFAVLPAKLIISPRRHLTGGVFRTVLLIFALRAGYWLGFSPFTLKRWFSDTRRAAGSSPELPR